MLVYFYLFSFFFFIYLCRVTKPRALTHTHTYKSFKLFFCLHNPTLCFPLSLILATFSFEDCFILVLCLNYPFSSFVFAFRFCTPFFFAFIDPSLGELCNFCLPLLFFAPNSAAQVSAVVSFAYVCVFVLVCN